METKNKMEIEKVRRDERKTIVISIRVSKVQSKWMSKNRVSPSKVFEQAINQLIDNQVAEEIAEKVRPKKVKKAQKMTRVISRKKLGLVKKKKQ